jgi:hypothetical protein
MNCTKGKALILFELSDNLFRGRVLRERTASRDRVSEPGSTAVIGGAGAEPPPTAAGAMPPATRVASAARFTPTDPRGSWRPVPINLRQAELEQVEALALAAGQSRSGWIRELVRQALAEQTEYRPATDGASL